MVGQDPSLAVTFNHCAVFLLTSNTGVKSLKHWICNLICFARSLGANPLGFNDRGLKDYIKKSVRSGEVCSLGLKIALEMSRMRGCWRGFHQFQYILGSWRALSMPG